MILRPGCRASRPARRPIFPPSGPWPPRISEDMHASMSPALPFAISPVRRPTKFQPTWPLTARPEDPAVPVTRHPKAPRIRLGRRAVILSPGGIATTAFQPANRTGPKTASASLAAIPEGILAPHPVTRRPPFAVAGSNDLPEGPPSVPAGRSIQRMASEDGHLKTGQPFDPSPNDVARRHHRRFSVPKYHPLQLPKAVSSGLSQPRLGPTKGSWYPAAARLSNASLLKA